MILGITGGVGSGKSTVLKYLKERHGAYLIQCDDVARQLQMPGQECYQKMLDLFGDSSLLKPDGSFDRKALAERVFSDEKLRMDLNRITHPAVKKRVLRLIDENRDSCSLIVIEAALLLEDNYGVMCDEIWYIYADENKRRRRLKDSRGYSDEKITSVMNSQMADEDCRKLCDLVIDNSSDNLQNTFDQLDAALSERGIC